jgi:outer membrane lipoprotein carrier protein
LVIVPALDRIVSTRRPDLRTLFARNAIRMIVPSPLRVHAGRRIESSAVNGLTRISKQDGPLKSGRRITAMIKATIWFAAAVLLVTIPAVAEDIHSIAAAVNEHYNHLHSLQAEFTEVYRGSGMERTESGTVWLAKGGLKKPGKMRWEYRSPREKLFVSDGKDAWFYVPGDRQARKTDARKLDDVRSPLAFLLGKSKLEKELQGLSLAPDVAPVAAGDVVLRGVPRALADRVSEILLEVTPEQRIARIVIDEVDGSVTEYRFSEQKENEAIPDGRFQFNPPPGTETVENEIEP